MEESHAAEPHLRPAMRSAEDLPEPWVRLAMARSLAAKRRKSSRKLAMGLGIAVLAGCIIVWYWERSH
jgi:ferric-dicitrate binding protein FerR (iron transport regulator)